jgi:hypothetical protein
VQQWEYLWVKYAGSSGEPLFAAEIGAEGRTLSEFGADGWEAVSYTPSDTVTARTVLLKRCRISQEGYM